MYLQYLHISELLVLRFKKYFLQYSLSLFNLVEDCILIKNNQFNDGGLIGLGVSQQTNRPTPILSLHSR